MNAHQMAVSKSLAAYGRSYLLKKAVDDSPEYEFNNTWIVYNLRESERQLKIARIWRRYAEKLENAI